jgi:hypothetical protein
MMIMYSRRPRTKAPTPTRSVKKLITRDQDRRDSFTRRYYEKELGAGVGPSPSMKEHFGYTEPFRRFVQHETFSPQANEIPNTAASWLPGDDYYVNFHEGDPFIKVDEGYARLPGEGYAALHPELKDVNPEDYPDIHKLAILADVAPYSREYNTYRQKIGREAQGNTELDIEYEKILTRVKKTRESVIRMTDRHYTEPVDEISGTVESASPGGITLKGRSLRPAGHKNPRAPAPEAPRLRSHAHRQPGQRLHQSRAGQLSMISSLHRSITTWSSLSSMAVLSMTCDPVGTDGVEITVELMGLYLYR